MRHISGARVAACTAAALGVAMTGLAIVAPTQAATVTCDGQAATIVATADQQDLMGTDGPDVISTNGFSVIDVFAGGGDDVICSGPGDPPGVTIQGEIHGEGGNDTLISSSSDPTDVQELYGGAGDDVLELESGSAELRPGPGDDTVHAPADPVLVAGSPAVSLEFDRSGPPVQVDVPDGSADGQGHDTYTGFMLFRGTAGADVFTGGPGRDFYVDGATLDTKHPGPDSVSGGAGEDNLFVLHGTIRGGAGDDLLTGGHAAVHGGPGRDSIAVLDGGHGSGGPGADVIRTGIDEEQFDPVPTQEFVLEGGPGPDRIFVTSPSDEGGFMPCPRTKVCRFSADGGPGSDVLSFRRTAGRVHLDLARGRATYVGGHASVRGFEAVEGSLRGDTLRGTRGVDHLEGKGGSDRLFGRGGPDVLDGGPGRHDVANGGPGLDLCLAEVRHSCRAPDLEGTP